LDRSGEVLGREGRLIYAGTVAVQGGWAASIAVMEVKSKLADLEVLVGLSSTYSNYDTVLVDLSGPKAAAKIRELTEDAVFLSPRLRVARSFASEKQWSEHVADIFNTEAEDFVEKVWYRLSAGGGTVAIPPILKEHKDRRKYEERGRDGRELQVIIRFAGEFVEARKERWDDSCR
jgi:hypothetical protein